MIGVGFLWMIGLAAITVIIGVILKSLSGNFLRKEEAKIASFAFMIGNSVTLFTNFDFDYVSSTKKIGSLVGLLFLWWLLFKRKATSA